jgi:hypothetical protein
LGLILRNSLFGPRKGPRDGWEGWIEFDPGGRLCLTYRFVHPRYHAFDVVVQKQRGSRHHALDHGPLRGGQTQRAVGGSDGPRKEKKGRGQNGTKCRSPIDMTSGRSRIHGKSCVCVVSASNRRNRTRRCPVPPTQRYVRKETSSSGHPIANLLRLPAGLRTATYLDDITTPNIVSST